MPGITVFGKLRQEDHNVWVSRDYRESVGFVGAGVLFSEKTKLSRALWRMSAS